MKKIKRITMFVLACLMVVGGTITAMAKEAPAVRGSIFGYGYVGTLSLTETKVKASLAGEAEVPREVTPDEPSVKISGRAYYDSNGRYQFIEATGIKSCRYEASIGAGDHAECTYWVEGANVGGTYVYL